MFHYTLRLFSEVKFSLLYIINLYTSWKFKDENIQMHTSKFILNSADTPATKF